MMVESVLFCRWISFEREVDWEIEILKYEENQGRILTWLAFKSFSKSYQRATITIHSSHDSAKLCTCTPDCSLRHQTNSCKSIFHISVLYSPLQPVAYAVS